MSVGNTRNSCQALQYLISEAKNTLDLLQRINKEIHRRIDERDLAPSSDLNAHDLGLCATALKSYLVITVGKMLDPNPRSCSFKTIKWFTVSVVKELIEQIGKEEIIKKIMNDRHTWTAHLDSVMKGTVTRDEICNSNLSDLLNKLEKIWINYFFIMPK